MYLCSQLQILSKQSLQHDIHLYIRTTTSSLISLYTIIQSLPRHVSIPGEGRGRIEGGGEERSREGGIDVINVLEWN